MGRGIMEITPECIVEALRLPYGTKIVDVRSLLFSQQASDCGPSLEIIVESDSLKPVGEGSPLPRVSPLFREQCGVQVFDRWS